jgi:hypothetical protein
VITLTDPTARAIEGLQTMHDTIVEHPDRWTQGASFRDQHGKFVRDPDAACSACLYGLARVAIPDQEPRTVARMAMQREVRDLTLQDGRRGLDVPDWQDRSDRTVAEVRVLILHTIQRLQTGR